MRAVLCTHLGPPEELEVAELPSPQAGPGQVVVRVEAAGVNYPDALVVQGKHQYKPALPFCVGSELAGTVIALGPGVASLAVGQRVFAGGAFRGSFAEEVVLDANQLQSIPEGVSFEHAAAVSVTCGTSYYALVQLAKLRAGETVLVLGAAGGVGLSAVQIAKALGARVIAAASSAEKLAFCRAEGADETIDYTREDLRERIRALTGGRGVDIVYDPVGGRFAEPALRGMAWRGRYLVIGFAAGEIPKIPLNLVLLKNASVIGVFMGEAFLREPETAAQTTAGVAELLRAKRIAPHISGRYRLDEVPQALRALLERRVTGKIVVLPQSRGTD